MQFEPKEKEYNQYVETITPVSNSARNCLWAFLIGGLICTIGQVLFNLFEYAGLQQYRSTFLPGCIAGKGQRRGQTETISLAICKRDTGSRQFCLYGFRLEKT